MSTKSAKNYWSEVLLVPFVFMLLGVILLFAAYYFTSEPMRINAHGQSLTIPNSDPLIKFLLKEIGFAFLVAATLAVSIDFITRRKHEVAADRLVDRMKENLFHAVFGRDVPPKLYSQVKRHFLNTEFYRTDFKVVFVFGSAGEDPANVDPENFVKYMEQTSYVVKNISNIKRTYPIQITLEGSSLEIEEGPKSYKYEDLKVNNKNVAFDVQRDSVRGCLVASYNLDLSPGEDAKIDSATHAYVRFEDEMIITMTIPTEGVAISAVSHVPSLVVRASSNHPEELEEIRKDPTFMEWRQESAMFPGQGFVLSWEKK